MPDLAAGDLFGSSLAKMLILAIVVLVSERRGTLPVATPGHVLSAALAIALHGAAAVFLLASLGGASLPVGPGPVLLLLGFLAGLRVVHASSARPAAQVQPPAAEHERPARPSLRGAATRFGLGAVAVVGSAPVFADSAKRIAELSGLGPVDLAIGNLFGSNAFNMAVFFPLDLVHPGPILEALTLMIVLYLGGLWLLYTKASE